MFTVHATLHADCGSSSTGSTPRYTEFFFLQDLVRDDGTVRFYLPFQGFRNGPLPQDLETYPTYCRRMALFFRARTRRIEKHLRAGLALGQRVLLQARHRWVAARG